MSNKAPAPLPPMLSDAELLKKLRSNGITSTDLSSGDPVALAAYNRIVYLEGMLKLCESRLMSNKHAPAPAPSIEWRVQMTWGDYFEQMLADFKALAVACIQNDNIEAAETALVVITSNAFHKLREIRNKSNGEYIGEWPYHPAKVDK